MSNRLYGPAGVPGTAGSLAANTSGAAAAVLPVLTLAGAANTSETVVLNPALNSASQALVVNIPAGGPLEQRKFYLRISGYVIGGTTTNVTLKTYVGSSATVGSNGTAIGSTGGVACNSAKAPFMIECAGIYDSVSGKLQMTFKSLLNNTLVAEVAGGATYTGITNSGTNGGAVASFVLTYQFSAGNAANAINVQEFAIYEA